MLKIVVPYRDREISLRLYLLYNIPFLNYYYTNNYEIAIVEQEDDGNLFSLSKAINAGFRILNPKDEDTFVFSPVDIYFKQPCLECNPNDKMKIFTESKSNQSVIDINEGYDFFSTLGSVFRFSNGLDNRCEGWSGDDRLFLKYIKSFNKNFDNVKKIYIGNGDIAYQDQTNYVTKNKNIRKLTSKEFIKTEIMINEGFSAPNTHGIKELVNRCDRVIEYSPVIKHYIIAYK